MTAGGAEEPVGGGDAFAVVLVGAGSGTRLGLDMPKALVPLHGKPLYQHVLETVSGLENLALVVLVLPENEITAVGKALTFEHAKAAIKLVAGGANRTRSTVAGLRGVHAAMPVLVHDVARTLASKELFEDVAERLRGEKNLCVAPLLPVPDAIKRAHGEVVIDAPSRVGYYLTQTPQGLSPDLAAKLAADEAADAQDEAAWAMGVGGKVVGVPGERRNFKITYEDDLAMAAFFQTRGKGE